MNWNNVRCLMNSYAIKTPVYWAKKPAGSFVVTVRSFRKITHNKFIFGTPHRNRTCNLWYRKPTLYPVELTGHLVRCLQHSQRTYNLTPRVVQLDCQSAKLVHPARFELATTWFEAKYSNPLSYGCITDILYHTSASQEK